MVKTVVTLISSVNSLVTGVSPQGLLEGIGMIAPATSCSKRGGDQRNEPFYTHLETFLISRLKLNILCY